MIFIRRVKWLSAGITLVTSLILITPLCGFLFQCGCDWPWLGLDAKCNIHSPRVIEKCPWCVSLAAGVLSTGIAILSGVYVSMISTNRLLNQHLIKEVLIRILFGVTVFVLVAATIAKLTASWQKYPLSW